MQACVACDLLEKDTRHRRRFVAGITPEEAANRLEAQSLLGDLEQNPQTVPIFCGPARVWFFIDTMWLPIVQMSVIIGMEDPSWRPVEAAVEIMKHNERLLVLTVNVAGIFRVAAWKLKELHC